MRRKLRVNERDFFLLHTFVRKVHYISGNFRGITGSIGVCVFWMCLQPTGCERQAKPLCAFHATDEDYFKHTYTYTYTHTHTQSLTHTHMHTHTHIHTHTHTHTHTRMHAHSHTYTHTYTHTHTHTCCIKTHCSHTLRLCVQ